MYLAAKTWELLQGAPWLGIRIGENSITDFNLLALQHLYPSRIVTIAYDQRWREPKTGADWEWWLTDKQWWIGLRVQAKKIGSLRLRYPALTYSQNKSSNQIDILISEAWKSTPPRIPIYVFYNYWNNPDASAVNDRLRQVLDRTCRARCEGGVVFPPRLPGPPLSPICFLRCPSCAPVIHFPQMFGCAMSRAEAVRAILTGRGNWLKEIAKTMYPWCHLVCQCRPSFPDRSRAGLPWRALDFLRLIMRDDVERFPYDTVITQEPPDYVVKLVRHEELSLGDWEHAGVNRIVVTSDWRLTEPE